MDTESFIVYVKTNDIYKDMAEYFETTFGISNYELYRPLPNGKSKKVIGLMIAELGRTVLKEFLGLRAKIYSYLIEDGREDKKAKGTKLCVIKRKLNLKIIKTV